MVVGDIINNWEILKLNVKVEGDKIYSKCKCVKCGDTRYLNNTSINNKGTRCIPCRKEYIDSFIK